MTIHSRSVALLGQSLMLAYLSLSGTPLLAQEALTPETQTEINAPQDFHLPTQMQGGLSAFNAEILIRAGKAYSARKADELRVLLNQEPDPRAKELITLMAQLTDINRLSVEAGERQLESFNNDLWRERFRREWVLELANRGSWPAVLRHAQKVEEPSLEHRCAHALAMAQSGQQERFRALALPAFRDINRAATKGQTQCRDLTATLFRAEALPVQERLAHLRRLMFVNGQTDFMALPLSDSWVSPPSSFKHDHLWLPAERLDTMIRLWLDSTQNNSAPLSTAQAEWLTLVIAKFAGDEPERAIYLYQRVDNLLKPTQVRSAQTFIALGLARKMLAQGLPWLQQAQYNELWPAQQEMLVRLALREKQWPALQRGIEQLPSGLQQSPTWRYWWAMSLLIDKNEQAFTQPTLINQWLAVDLSSKSVAQHPEAFAVQTLKSMAREADFYGALAAETLGDKPYIPPFTAEPTMTELSRARDDACLQWASTLIQMGGVLRTFGVAQWRQCIRSLDDRALLAASQIAVEREIFDRAVNTAILTQKEHDWRARFIKPFADVVKPQAQTRGLSWEWVYGLMRQESRFMVNAQSGVGARGLMQIMPKTGAWLAKKEGLKNFSLTQLDDININVQLGTRYLQSLFERFNHPALVSAAYNAGPGRAQRWRPLSGSMEAVRYIETIPFTETRGYVKNVLWNATMYQLLDGQANASLSRWLLPITASTTEVNDLP